jgi:hypothetical protein
MNTHWIRQHWLWQGPRGVWGGLTAVFLLTALQLHHQGRLWICSCGQLWLWAGDIWSANNSQHLFDPYSFTHLLHGLAFFWILAWLLPQFNLSWRLFITIAVEATWEIIENAPFIINRYRETTLALGYNGDTVINSLADIWLCGVGFVLAQRLGWRRTLFLFSLTELILTLWIRDGLLLNVLMLLYPIDAIRTWQMGLAH